MTAKATKKGKASKPKAAKRPASKASKPTKKIPAKVKPVLAKGGAHTKVASAPTKKPPAPAPEAKKPGKKGITVVEPKAAAAKKPKVKTPISVVPASAGRLLDPKNPVRKPLIPSGPKAAHLRPLGAHTPEPEGGQAKEAAKSPYGKKELAHFRAILVRKRAELVGDVSQMEREALKGQSGSLSSLPQHIADQGSDTYDQSLALNLAAADRKLIREIDEAIKRIDEGTYGVCELTGKPIKPERLEELPWARYSIEAARELERRNMWAS